MDNNEEKNPVEEPQSTGLIQPVEIDHEMRTAYIDYSMSVIVSRALPDARDGLKPVQRRVLYGMNEMGVKYTGQTKKSARIVGDVMGKYHPHGDSSVYDAMVRLGQWWNQRYPMVWGQGNFGSMDGDSPAAMRYTEAKLEKMSEDVLADLDKDTVDMDLNFDGTLEEPKVLPTKAPLLLLNGASGIAVGMATNMAPHNLGECCDAICAYIDNPEITTDELMQYIKGPDFPTGGIVMGRSGIREAYETGRGRVVVRSKTDIEVDEKGHETIVVTEIPYMVNKREMIEKIAQLADEKKIEGISYINDESSREGIRVVIRLKQGVNSGVVLNTLFKYTPLQSSFSFNNVALVKGRPRTLSLKEILRNFVDFRHEVVVRRTKFELDKAKKRAHILEGLLKAMDIIDEIVHVIRYEAASIDEARQILMDRWDFTEIQATEIVNMRLRQLVGLEREKLQNEYDELMKFIAHCEEVLASVELQLGIVKDETRELKEKYADPRRTEITLSADEFNPEDFYSDEDQVITISHLGYIKRTPLTEFRTQNRGGVGIKASAQRHPRRGLHRAHLHREQPLDAPALHPEGPLPLAEGVRDPRRQPRLQGPRRPEHPHDRPGRQDQGLREREDPQGRGVHQQQLHHDGHPPGHREEDFPGGLLPSEDQRRERHQYPRGRRTAGGHPHQRPLFHHDRGPWRTLRPLRRKGGPAARPHVHRRPWHQS